MYDLIDSFTFKLRAISPSLWPTFEMTYRLFKSDAIDFLEGEFLFLAMLILFDLTFFQRCCLPLITFYPTGVT